MAKSENMQTVALNLDKGTYKKVQDLAREASEQSGEYISATRLMTQAINGFLDDEGKDPRLLGIAQSYGAMNEDGRAFLATFAALAASHKPYRG